MPDIEEYLKAKGYQLYADGRYRRPRRRVGQVWEKTKGGWLRFDYVNGEETPEVHSAKEGFEDGLDKKEHPEAYNWVYSNEAMARIFKPE